MEAVAAGHERAVESDRECITGIGLYDSEVRARRAVKAAISSLPAGEPEIGRNECGVPLLG